MTQTTFAKLSKKMNDGKLEVEYWTTIRHGRGIAQVRTANGERKMVQVEGVPAGFTG